ncbi:uncharacterized protein LOC126803722 [Argentina anserina]|uniref:uncharacterized protein LOC126803722 n=1 Tax=Argentina anserina TaxID=57926 RepID=UPI0021766C3A|nr:uncharacterized protein LOC126803722 [Potentilla anserina]
MALGRKGFKNQYGNDQSVDFSMPHTVEDPSSCLSFSRIRKVKVNEVQDSEIAVSASLGHSYRRGGYNTISLCTFYNKSDENIISLSPPYNDEENSISLGTTFNKAEGNFISVGHTFGKGDETFISMAHNYSKGDIQILSMGQPFEKENGSFVSIGQSYEKEDGSFISLGNSYNKVHENFISMGSVYGRGDENSISVAPTFEEADTNRLTMGSQYDKSDRDLPLSHNYNKNESNTICFGGLHDESETNRSGGIIHNCGFVTCNQYTTAQASEEADVRKCDHYVESKMDAHIDDTEKLKARSVNIPKVKEPKTKKALPNNFPSNVKSLLSTGMLDGIPVKYFSWSREKNLDGIIKGTGYLCSCADCNHSKVMNSKFSCHAYEFERNAGAETKHPNNHIYFENGKTIHAVVQELKTTPQDMLFDVIQTVTGSQINQKNFRVWKASFQAACGELQRIYGKDEVAIPS